MATDRTTGEIIPRLIRWGTALSSFRAMVLTSTRAVPGAPVDILSDYHVILIVDDIHPFVVDRSWLNDWGDVQGSSHPG